MMKNGETLVPDILTDRIEELKLGSRSSINNIQKEASPMVKRIYMKHQYEYYYRGYKYNIWQDDVQLFAVNELPYTYDAYKDNTSFTGKLEDLVNEGKIWAFLLFVNDKVIPWSKITVIKDYDYSYIFISDVSEPVLMPINDTPYELIANMIWFPIHNGKLRYGEDEDYTRDPATKGLYFNKDGLFVQDPTLIPLSVRLEIFDEKIYFKKTTLADTYSNPGSDIKYLQFDGLDEAKLTTLNNVIVFDPDGFYFGSGDDNIANIFVDDPINGSYNLYKIDPSINTSYNLVLMYFDNYEKSSSYIYTKEIDKEKVINFCENRASNYQRDLLLSKLDFGFNRDVDYETNVRRAMRTISVYDFALWNQVFINKSPIQSLNYTGAEFRKLADRQSYVRLSRKHSDHIEDVVIVFVNSKIYKYMVDVTYVNNTINIPSFDINDNDHVEIIVFNECNNNVLDIVISDPNTGVYISDIYNLDDCYIMDTETRTMVYPSRSTNVEKRRQFICDYTYKKIDGLYYIVFTDTFHYHRRLKIVPKNQFKYYRFNDLEGQFSMILPQKFNYCHDLDRYMIFVNGQKITKEQYTITIMNNDRPFEELNLYLTTILEDSDVVEVFYVPEYLKEKYKVPQTDLKGVIKLTTDYPKLYALSKHTCMVFVNGYKINPLDIVDVSMNTMMVNTDLKEIYDVSIVEYIEGSTLTSRYLYQPDNPIPLDSKLMGDTTYEEATKTLYDLTSQVIDDIIENRKYMIGLETIDYSLEMMDAWRQLVDSITTNYSETYGMIFNEFPEITEAEVGYRVEEDYAPLRSVLYDIVVDHYVQRAGVTTGNIFTYDFEIEEFDQDANGDTIIELYNVVDKIVDYDLSAESAKISDVTEGKTFLST